MDNGRRGDRPSFDEALAIIRAHAVPRGSERVPLFDALHRVTAAPVHAASAYPRFDAAAMDGFGLSAADGAAASPDRPVRLPIAGIARAGAVPPPLAPHTACRINTGAPVPVGCDAVLPFEEARIEHGRLVLERPIRSGRNVRRRGEDAEADAPILPSATLLTPDIIGALACYGCGEVTVVERPRIVILPTGDELLASPSADHPAAIFDANTVMLSAMARTLGLDPVQGAPIGDDRARIERAVADASCTADIVVTSGGAAGGEYDHLAGALARLGAMVHFHGVRMRPGKPLLFATLPNGTLFFGLPGNPVAALLGARFFLSAAVRAMTGAPPETGEPVDIVTESKSDTTLFLKAVRTPAGEIRILADQRSHTLRPLIEANCWIATDSTPLGTRSRVYSKILPIR
jgi:molybdopterin molybdotransferase